MRILLLLAGVVVFSCVAGAQGINVCYPGEAIGLDLSVPAGKKTSACDLVVSDWRDRPVLRRPYVATDGRVSLSAGDVGTFGAFRVEVVERGATNSPLAKTWFARLRSRKVEPVDWLGTCAHFIRRDCYHDGRFVDMLAAAGIGYVRNDYSWHGVETGPGEYRETPRYDKWFGELEKRGIGMVILFQLWQVPPCYPDKKDISAFPAFCAYVARRYQGRKCIFEIYNEPQNTALCRKAYAEEAKATKNWHCWLNPLMDAAKKAAKAIHEADPKARVYVTGEDVEFLLKMMIETGVATEREGISFHPYGHKIPFPERIYWFKDNGAEIRALARAHGGATRFCGTEAGVPTILSKSHRHDKVAGDFICTTVAQQAAFITRLYLMSRLTGLDLMCQYCWMDEGTDPNYTEHNFGQVFHDGTPKPAFAATAQLACLLGHAKVVGERSPEPEKWRLAEFVRETSAGERRIFACWSVEKDLEVPFPEVLKGATFVDLMGNGIPVPIGANGKLKLEPFPVYAVCLSENK